MKKIFILMVTFCMLLSLNVNAGKNVNFNGLSDFSLKTEIFDKKNTRKIKTIQKLFSTKIGKWVLKKAVKKLQKDCIKNDIKSKKELRLTNIIVVFFLGVLLLLGGIGLLIGGYTALGIILGVLGLFVILALTYLLALIGRSFSGKWF